MACDLSTQRKKLGWEKDNLESAPCRAAWGFAHSGSMPKYFWAVPDQLQVAPQWIFLNYGVLLESQGQQAEVWRYVYAQLLPPATVELAFGGFNEVQVAPASGLKYTVLTFCGITGTVALPSPDSWSELSGRIDFAPSVRDEFFFGLFRPAGEPTELGTFLGGLKFTPLKHCHNCVTGP